MSRPVCPAPRITWACENCRSRKTRCLPSAKGGICERCLTSRAQCVFPSRSQEPKRSLHGRDIKEQSLKLSPKPSVKADDVLGNLLTCSSQQPKPENELGTLQALHRRILERLFPHALWKFPSQETHVNPVLPNLVLQATIPDVKIYMSPNQAEKCLKKFQSLNHYFPFVVLPTGWTLALMLKKHPFLALGVFSAMSTEDPHLNQRLDTEFKKVLSEKVVMHGERSLDTLQGLIVYLAWYPMHLNPRNMQLYQFLSICCTMVRDLEYDLPPEQRDHGTFQAEYIDLTPEMRAYLGSYYLASALAMSKRPNPLRFSVYAEYCLAQFEEHSTLENDQVLVSYIKLQVTDEAASWNTKPSNHPHNLEPSKSSLEALIDSLNIRLQALTMAEAHALRNNQPAGMLQLYVRMKIYAHAIVLEDALLANTPISSARLTALTTCLHAAKAVLEHLVALPAASYRNFGMVEWSRFINTIVTILRLCAVTPTVPDWEFTAQKQKATFSVYLESISLRMTELSRTDTENSAPPDIFCMFASILKIVRGTYEDLVTSLTKTQQSLGSSNLSPEAARPQCPMFQSSLKETDYWNAFTNYTSMPSFESQSSNSGPQEFDFLSWESWENGIVGDNDLSVFGITGDEL